jgi:hypothetical protein
MAPLAGKLIPDCLKPRLRKVAVLTGLVADSFRQALVTDYAPEADIGRHRGRAPVVALPYSLMFRAVRRTA